MFSDLTGQINLLTTTTFNSPQDLFVLDAAVPQAAAYMSLVVPGNGGEWLMRGTIMRGDLASWIASGAYRRAPGADHVYEAGFTYGAQRYLGTTTDALLTISDPNRNVGTMYAYDNWTVVPRVRVGYGAQYSRYDYLEGPGLISPRASVTIQPSADDSLKLRALVSRRESAPGAIEFTPTSTGPWLPPERTFAQVSGAAFQPERLDHIELAAEREWAGAIIVGVRAFRQNVDDQMVTMFGLGLAGSPTGIGHYFVGSAGDFSAYGWSVSVSRPFVNGVRASVDYTQSTADWYGAAPDADALAILAPQALRANERIHDVTATVDSVVAASATRVCVVYKMNSAFTNPGDNFSASLANARFNVQVNQALPFLNFANANWEMLAAISNLFTADAVDGSVYDEALVTQPPKRILGGVTVRF